jgi:hypothetical protein
MRAVDPRQFGSRRHDRAHWLVGQPQHALDHVALLHFQNAGLRALDQQRLQFLLRHRLPRRAVQAERAQDQAGGSPQQPHRRGDDAGQDGDRAGHPDRHQLRRAQRQLLRHQLPQHEREVGGDDDDQGQRQAVGETGDRGEAGLQPGLQVRGDAGAAEHAGEHADQGDAHLHRRQEALRIVRQRPCRHRPLDPLPLQHRQPRPADRDEGQFAQREQPVQHDQQQDNDNFEADGHWHSRWSRRTINANCTPLP